MDNTPAKEKAADPNEATGDAESGARFMDEPISIDICAASNVYLADNEMYYD